MNSPKAAMKLLGANRSSPSEKFQSVPVGPSMVSTCKKSYRPERTTMKGADSKHRHSLRAFVHHEISFKTILRRFCKKTQHVHDSKKLTYDSEDVFVGDYGLPGTQRTRLGLPGDCEQAGVAIFVPRHSTTTHTGNSLY